MESTIKLQSRTASGYALLTGTGREAKVLTTRMILATVLVVSVLLLMGCVHTHYVALDSPESFGRLHKDFEQRDGIVELLTGETFGARALRADADSTSWIDPQNDRVTTVGTDEVASVRFVDRGRGAGEGMGLGLIPAAAGALIASGSEEEDGCWLYCSAGERAAVTAVVLGVPGIVVGGIVGAVAGRKDVFVFPNSPEVNSAERQRRAARRAAARRWR